MSRGRHRHSSLLSRALLPTAAAVLTVAALAALLVSPDQVVVRSVGVAAVLAVLGTAMVLRQRDRAARAAAETAAVRRLRDEERYEEQLAEAEYAAEVAEERAARLGRRLTAEKSRLAKAETEIARLLKERAVQAAEQALKEAEAAQRAIEAARPKHPVTPVTFLRAANALRALERRAELAQAQAEHLARRQAARRAAAALPATASADPAALPEVRQAHAPAVPQSRIGRLEPVAARGAAEGERAAVAPSPVRPVLAAPGSEAAAAPAPMERQRQRPRPQAGHGRGPGFSFFDRTAAMRAAAPAPAVGSVRELAEQRPEPVEPDLADVLGDEVADTRVVDLTPEDDTELLDLGELRSGRTQGRSGRS
ncbi:hypothetical protein C7C46_06730 [Streptomyces tateyamensis]|uniref:Secreted protein n=1 Tax=Streptomyces tateyamensis TaxID=565073 RepID=A0A2V4NR40_9ACTN|nr:hypothetical protein [Streptomyces tateyamensis]PYC85430.1 hypothetical protein C7C46_06730 [Streptomyces tateyamensis]